MITSPKMKKHHPELAWAVLNKLQLPSFFLSSQKKKKKFLNKASHK
jgi:hypothetical protein